MFLFFLSLCFYMRTLECIYIGLPHLCLLQEKHTLPSLAHRMQKCICKQHALMYNIIKVAIDSQKVLIKSANG